MKHDYQIHHVFDIAAIAKQVTIINIFSHDCSLFDKNQVVHRILIMKYSMHEKWNMKRIETRESWVIDFFYARIPKLKKNHVQVELIKEQSAKQICFQKCGLYNFVHILFVLALRVISPGEDVYFLVCSQQGSFLKKKKPTQNTLVT